MVILGDIPNFHSKEVSGSDVSAVSKKNHVGVAGDHLSKEISFLLGRFHFKRQGLIGT